MIQKNYLLKKWFQNYWYYDEEYSSIAYPGDKEYIKVWRRFKRIEEFDPIDFDY